MTSHSGDSATHLLPLVSDLDDCDGVVTYDGTPVTPDRDDGPTAEERATVERIGRVLAGDRAAIEAAAARAGVEKRKPDSESWYAAGTASPWALVWTVGGAWLARLGTRWTDIVEYPTELDALLALPPTPSSPRPGVDSATTGVGHVRRGHVLHSRSLDALDRRGLLAMCEEFQRLHPEHAASAYARAVTRG